MGASGRRGKPWTTSPPPARSCLDAGDGVTMPLTYSIATGIGFITYALCKLIAGKFTDAKPAVLVLALIFAIKLAIG